MNSDGLGEVIVLDSGCGGSMEDFYRVSVMIQLGLGIFRGEVYYLQIENYVLIFLIWLKLYY